MLIWLGSVALLPSTLSGFILFLCTSHCDWCTPQILTKYTVTGSYLCLARNFTKEAWNCCHMWACRTASSKTHWQNFYMNPIYLFSHLHLSLRILIGMERTSIAFVSPDWSLFCLQATSLVEVLCLLVFFGRLMHFAKITRRNVFWKDTKNICIMVAILVS